MIIDSKGIKLQSHITEIIKDFLDELRTKEMIHKFLGCLNYSSDFIKDLEKGIIKVVNKEKPNRME